MSKTRTMGALLALSLAGCASTQLTYNTVDVASSIERLQTQQALGNLGRFIDNPMAIPAQVDLVAGSVQTSNSVTPSITFPLSNALARGSTGLLTGITTAAVAGTVGANDTWQQAWTTAPVTDADLLRNLRAIYRYAVVPEADLRSEYFPILLAQGDDFVPDPYLLRQPHCVLCLGGAGHKRRIEDVKGSDLFPNPRLPKAGWLYWSSDPGAIAPARPYAGEGPAIDLGHYGGHELYMSQADYRRGVLADFTLFISGINSEPSAAGDKGGSPRATSGGGNSRTPGKRLFDYGVSPQIQPVPQ